MIESKFFWYTVVIAAGILAILLMIVESLRSILGLVDLAKTWLGRKAE